MWLKKTNVGWHAIEHHSGKILAYVLGTHKDGFLQLKALLKPVALVAYTDGWEPMSAI